MNKKETRKFIKNKIKEITQKEEKSFLIIEKLIPLLENYQVIALYAAMEDEVNLDRLISYLISKNKTVVLPRVSGEEILFYGINSLDDLVESDTKYHIREPLVTHPYNKKDIDVVVTPGLAFDYSLNRLGHGKGYYDRFLMDYKGLIIGVAFKEQVLQEVPFDSNDVKMDVLITN
ncbi:MAG: 5-formyltetrahydrofolate cyclo-ligase [Bacilli bacterium]|nr:5-formyltetrahydrofolate cyclo-ligase [Bacilli bacterium]